MGDDRPAVYTEEGGLTVVRASSLGYCLWELVAILQGHQPEPWPENVIRAMQEGTDGEAGVLARLVDAGWKLEADFAQQTFELACGPGIVVRYHPDGAGLPATQPTVRHLVEVKRLHRQSFHKIRRHGAGGLPPAYLWQVSAMMVNQRCPAVVVVENKGGTPDENGVRPEYPDDGELEFVWLDEPPRSWAQIIRRVRQIRDLAAGDDITTTDMACEQPDQWPCRFRELRPEPETPVAVPVPGEMKARFEEAAKLLDSAGYAKKEGARWEKEAKTVLEPMLADTKEQRLSTEVWESWLQPNGTYVVTNWEELGKALAEAGLSLANFQEERSKAKTVKVRQR